MLNKMRGLDEAMHFSAILPKDIESLREQMICAHEWCALQRISPSHLDVNNMSVNQIKSRYLLNTKIMTLNLLSHETRRSLGFAMISFQGMCDRFAKLDVVMTPFESSWYSLATCALTDFSFKNLGLESLQISLLEKQVQQASALAQLGWILDATLKDEIFIEGNFLSELRFGKLVC